MASKLSASGSFQGPNGFLFFEREGNRDGPCVLFIHGLGGTTNAYQPLVAGLQDFDLVRFDWSGHGRSALPKETSIDSYVKDCEAIIAHLNLSSVLIVGHSFGGLISLHLATKLPHIIKALLLLGPVLPPSTAGKQAMATRAEAVRQEGMAGVTDTIISHAFAPTSLKLLSGEIALAREMLTRQNPLGYALAVEALRNSRMPEWEGIKATTIVLSGEEDKVSTVSVGKVTISNIGKHAEQLVLPGVGHWHMLEAPPACIETIKKLANL